MVKWSRYLTAGKHWRFKHSPGRGTAHIFQTIFLADRLDTNNCYFYDASPGENRTGVSRLWCTRLFL